MSKTAVPDVYARIIKDVCEASRVDFEEGGVDLGALELLRQGWQNRLSSTKTNTFPWDPKPEPVAKTEPNTASNSNKPAPSTLPSNGASKAPTPSNTIPPPQIKQEAQQYGNQPTIQANYSNQQYPQGQPVSAQERAAALLQQQYGSRAGAQIARLQNQPPRTPSIDNGTSQQGDQFMRQQQQQQQQQPQQQQPYIKQEDPSQDYRQNYNASVPIKQSQVDGGSDARGQYETEIAHRRALVARGREANDRIIRDRILASQRDLEGGGLMMSLEAATSGTSGSRRTRKSVADSSLLSRAQGDAAGDEEEDEDAINSDLDDSDELDEAEHDEDNVQNIMLCTYDKVQRVKNKWKCTLKDGVLKVEDTDYVFHKGQGLLTEVTAQRPV